MNRATSVAGPWRVALLLTVIVCASPLGADSRLTAEQTNSSGPLDGMAFVGRLGPADENGEPTDDTLFFRNGHFWSKVCVPCGFLPGRYWVHRTAEAIQFRGQLESAEGGTFVYFGEYRDGQMSVSIDWKKERWYWTVEREFRFEGTLRDGGGSFATLDTAQSTAISARESGNTCEPG